MKRTNHPISVHRCPLLQIPRLATVLTIVALVFFAIASLIHNNQKYRVVPITDETLIQACNSFIHAKTMFERKQAATDICEIESKFIATNSSLRHSLHDFVKLLGVPKNRGESYGEYVIERNEQDAYYKVMVFRGYWREDIVDEVAISDAIE